MSMRYEIILMMKGTSLASTVTLMDLTGVAKYIISKAIKSVEGLLPSTNKITVSLIH